jgi:hypothetical protein
MLVVDENGHGTDETWDLSDEEFAEQQKQAKREGRAMESHTIGVEDLNGLMDTFEQLLVGKTARLCVWLEEEYKMPREEFGAKMKSLGKAVGRDFGIF